MSFIEIDQVENISILKLNRSTTNALNLEFLKDISMNLQKLKKDTSVDSVVFTSANTKFLSIGFDIPQLNELSKNELMFFYQTFNRVCLYMYTFPKPIVAAIVGHAIAGGCILTICCDYRYISEGRKLMGLNEIKLGLPVPYPADRILKQVIGTGHARIVIEGGKFYQPDELHLMGLVDQVLPIKKVQPMAIIKAKELGEMPKNAFSMIKRNRVERLEKDILKELDEREKYFLKSWYSDETQELLKEAFKKF